MVVDAPKIPEITDILYKYLTNRVVVHHSHFDRVAIQRALKKYGICYPKCDWLDSACVVRRTWKEFSWSGYGLENVCDFLEYKFEPHDALEDAKAAGFIFLEAIKKTGLDVKDWLKRVKQPIDPSTASYGKYIKREGNPEGLLFGESIVFTGKLNIVRSEAADIASQLGCIVKRNITQSTTMLVVGDQDIRQLAGHNKSSKHRKVEDLNRKGYKIKILIESDFIELINMYK